MLFPLSIYENSVYEISCQQFESNPISSRLLIEISNREANAPKYISPTVRRPFQNGWI